MASQTNGVTSDKLELATLEGRNKVLGFWMFLGGETVLFGCLFATFLALRNSVADGPAGQDLFEFNIVAWATFLLLTSSMTSVMAIVEMHRNNIQMMRLWFIVTVFLGAGFLGLEIYEFMHYVNLDLGFTVSAFASAFYTLVGFHGAHVAFGILWISLLVIQSYKKGLTPVTAPKFYVAALYWHFVDLVWVFIFTVVYLMGKVG
jgi:heme/copper-type cytochrome/quinol oxidase subunit 3